jgi:biotin synthase
MESPEYVRLSLAAAMTLGFVPGLFYRQARLGCINLLLTYQSGCKGNCAYCGLAREGAGQHQDRKFIRVPWQNHRFTDVLNRLQNPPSHVDRVCLSMITHPRSRSDVLDLCRAVRENTALPVSLLITPTLLKAEDLSAMKEAGADRIGVAIDAATPEIFDRWRGQAVRGPHQWDHYWTIYQKALEIFGRDQAGVHLIVGLGETEQDIAWTIGRSRDLGGGTHLFSFFPENGSAMVHRPQPPMGQYRRVQAARFLIDRDLTRVEAMTFNTAGQIVDYGLPKEQLDQALADGQAFETSGCLGASGRVACNRPYGNERPGPDIRNFPFTLDPDDLAKARREMKQY